MIFGHKKIFLLFLFLLIPLIGQSQSIEYLASEVGDNQVIHHTYYYLSYNEQYEQADWVAYELTAEEVRGTTARSDSFKEDWKITTGSASSSDYYKSGYDRGHLIPAADMKMSNNSMENSFYYSNISPQDPSLNRGIWRSLETTVRKWAETEGRIYVITGPALSKGIIKTIGPNKVGVPRYYYKVIFDPTDEIKAIGFILENSNRNHKVLSAYAVSVDSVEAFTGIDFFYNLTDDLEESAESKLDLSKWGFSNFDSISPPATVRSTAPTQNNNTYQRSQDRASSITCEYYNGKRVITGPRGGKYYINSNGNKTYVSKKYRSRIVSRACNN